MASIICGPNSTAFLQCIIEYCVTETNRPRTAQTNLRNLEIGLKIVSNCCCCVEGRMLVKKVCTHTHTLQLKNGFLKKQEKLLIIYFSYQCWI